MRGIATIWLGFAADLHAGNLLAVDSDGGPVSQDCIRILLPIEIAQKWAGSDQISLSFNRVDGGGPTLLIEKDFQCLHSDERNPSDDADAFPNPLAGDQGRETVR